MSDVLLEAEGLSCRYRLPGGGEIQALEGVSFQLRRGEIFGLVGESGSGKSTLVRCVMGLLRPSGGRVIYQGVDVWDPKQRRANRALLEASRQVVFQDSVSSLNPRMKAADLIAEPMAIQRRKPRRGSCRAEAAFQLKAVGLDESVLDKYPGELSGGQRQRVAIARALSMEPTLLAADEPTAALDVSIQAQILNLFRSLQREHGFTFLFVSHDLPVVRWLCSRVGVLYQGRLVELGPAAAVFGSPRHPYTQALVSAIPIPDPRLERARRPRSFDAASFRREGVLREASPEHFVLTAEGEEGTGCV